MEAADAKALAEAALAAPDEPLQQVIIIQGYSDGEVTIDHALEESAAATLQTLAMAGQVAEVLHITEDGQLIAAGREAAGGGGGAQYVVLESGDARKELRAMARAGARGHALSESSTALDALLSAVSEMGHHEERRGGDAAAAGAGGGGVHEVLSPEVAEAVRSVVQTEMKRDDDHEMQAVRAAAAAASGGMQEVLQLAASQMMKEGLTQVIVNNEGTHYIVTELDNCTLQVEGGVYGEEGEGQQAEPQAGEEMVVYLDGTPHNIVLEG
ncbi:Zinc finger protein 407 [Liparis tanakae]|uniref:Zinc finger protein 407 n=1 Tax=Liparis tanakae TaxID=230148 RepID=A0A4Z2EDY5_9TELE|nr:Zinc finger protein 407 [Liparis tanakae]